jgi:hypothetical protein
MIYEPEFADQARAMCRLGATDEELAEHFEVCVRTIYRWRNTHEAFAEAVVVGKEHADARVERALYSRVVGCTVERTRVFKHAGEDPVTVTYKEHLPPDPVAARHWLRVRQRSKWGDHQEKPAEPTSVERIQRALARVDEQKRLAEEARRSGTMPPQQPSPPPPPPPSPPEPELQQEPEQEPAPATRPDDDPAPEPFPDEDPDPFSNADRAPPPAPAPALAPRPPLFELFPRPGGGYGPRPPAEAAAPAPPPMAPLPPFRRGGYG